MTNKNNSPLRAGFWLTKQEQLCILAVCALALLGIASRYYYLKSHRPEVYMPPGIEAEKEDAGLIRH